MTTMTVSLTISKQAEFAVMLLIPKMHNHRLQMLTEIIFVILMMMTSMAMDIIILRMLLLTMEMLLLTQMTMVCQTKYKEIQRLVLSRMRMTTTTDSMTQ